MSNQLSDYEFAFLLNRELNGPNSGFSQTANRDSVICLSDESGDSGTLLSPPLRLHKTGEVTTVNQQAITTRNVKISQNDYFLPLLNTFIDLNDTQEWTSVNMEANIQQMFNKLKEQFWQKWLRNVNFEVKWDRSGIISDDSVFKIFETECQVLISSSAITRPRIELVSILLHIQIHMFISTCSKGSIRINIHDENFRQIMLFLNDRLNTKISTFHKFLYAPEEIEYPKQWYKCVGICQNYEPFHGTIRCTSIPNAAHVFWRNHEENCGGSFFKVFEITRTNPETLNEEKKYVRNVNYMCPKTRVPESKPRPKTVIQTREIFDLTDDNEEVKVQNLCDVIDLDATDYNLPSPTTGPFTNDFILEAKLLCEKCPFCQVRIGLSCFSSHIDTCGGFQQKVLCSPATALKINNKSSKPNLSSTIKKA